MPLDGLQYSRILDSTVLPDEAHIEAARSVVVSHAKDLEDAKLLFGMIGLYPRKVNDE